VVRKVLMTLAVIAALAGGGAAIASAATSSDTASSTPSRPPATTGTGHGAAPRPGATPGSSQHCPYM